MEKKKYIDILTHEADRNKRPYEMALSDFLDFLLDFFSIDAFKGDTGHYAKHVKAQAEQYPDFALLALQWLSDVSDAMERGTWLDAFGILYEEMYLSRGKAAKTGAVLYPSESFRSHGTNYRLRS